MELPFWAFEAVADATAAASSAKTAKTVLDASKTPTAPDLRAAFNEASARARTLSQAASRAVDAAATLSALRDLYSKLVQCLLHAIHSPHLRSMDDDRANDDERIRIMEESAVTHGMSCDVQDVYRAICTSNCSFVTTTDGSADLFVCMNHGNLHYCGSGICDRRVYAPDACTCTLTGTMLDPGCYAIDDCAATSRALKPVKKDDESGDTSDVMPTEPLKLTRTLREYNRYSKSVLAELAGRSSRKRPSLLENMRRIGLEASRCIRKRHQRSEDDDDDDDEGVKVRPVEEADFSDDIYHHRREHNQPVTEARPTPVAAAAARRKRHKAALASATAAAAAAATIPANGDDPDRIGKRPVTDAMREKQRRLFRKVDPSSSSVPDAKKQPHSLSLTSSFSSSSSSASSSATSPPRAKKAPRDAPGSPEEAQILLSMFIKCRNDLSVKKSFDNQESRVEATPSEMNWFGQTCHTLWKALQSDRRGITTDTPKQQRIEEEEEDDVVKEETEDEEGEGVTEERMERGKKKSIFSFPYLCLFVLLNVARDGLRYRATTTRYDDDGSSTTGNQWRFIAPNLDLHRKAPRVPDIQHIPGIRNLKFTNRLFTYNQRLILGAFATVSPEENEKQPGDSALPDLTAIIINQPSKASITTVSSAASGETGTITATTTTATAAATRARRRPSFLI